MAATALGNIPLSTTLYPASDVDTALQALASGVSEEIASAVSTAWKAGGSKAPTDLTSALLVAANEGKVYNMSASGTTDSNFMEGSGKSYAAGTDIAVINDGTAESPVYKFNVLATYDASVVKSITVGASTITPAFNGSITFSGTNGVSVHSGGGATVTIDGSGLSGIISGIGSGLDVVSSVASGAASGLSGLKNFSGVHVHSGSGDTGYTPISATSNADTLTLKAGSNVTLVPNTSDKSVTINATAAPESSGFAHVTNGSGTIDADSAADTLTVSGTAPIGISLDTTKDKVTISHATCGPSSSGNTSKGDTTAQSPSFGETFKALSATVDKHGHVTALGEHTVTIPNSTVVPSNSGSGGSAGLMSANDKEKLNLISCGANVGITEIQDENGCGAVASSGTIVTFCGNNITITATSGENSGLVTFSVPSATSSGAGVVEIASSISETGTVVPTAEQVVAEISGVESGLAANIATKVSGGSLHTALSGSGLANGVGSGNNTIYALINALHSVDGAAEA